MCHTLTRKKVELSQAREMSKETFLKIVHENNPGENFMKNNWEWWTLSRELLLIGRNQPQHPTNPNVLADSFIKHLQNMTYTPIPNPDTVRQARQNDERADEPRKKYKENKSYARSSLHPTFHMVKNIKRRVINWCSIIEKFPKSFLEISKMKIFKRPFLKGTNRNSLCLKMWSVSKR